MSTNKTQALIEHASAAALLVSPLVAAAVGYAAFAPAPANALNRSNERQCAKEMRAESFVRDYQSRY